MTKHRDVLPTASIKRLQECARTQYEFYDRTTVSVC